MTIGKLLAAIGAALSIATLGGTAMADGSPERGAEAFRKCAACHSTEKGRHTTGPSLADIWDRKAGTVEGFRRYSQALRQSGVTWTERSLDEWLLNPRAYIPGNRMTFRGIENAQERADIVAYLKSVAAGSPPKTAQRGGMMGAGRTPDLKKVGPERQVKSIRYCGDTYTVTTAADQTLEYWEFNLRFKSDGGDNGPVKGIPVVTRAGMMGDRASVVFAGPEEISPFIERTC